MQKSVPLAPRTTLGVGGAARRFLEVGSETALIESLRRADGEGWPVFLLGGGSNLVIHDDGWPGLVLSLSDEEISDEGSSGTLTVGAGACWDGFVLRCAERGLAGVECLAGIPGTVGATPVQNVGAYGQEVARSIAEVRALDRRTWEFHTLSAADCGFGYRRSRFNGPGEIDRWIIVSATFALTPGGAPSLGYADLQRHFGPAGKPSLTDVYHAVREIRGRKGMVVDDADAESRSAGSFFKNPVVDAEEAPDGCPQWPAENGRAKLPAAWLIERAGLEKGTPLVGGMRLSTKHPLALVNRGDATALDVAKSARLVQGRVSDAFGIALHPEPLFVGPWRPDSLPDGATALLPKAS